MNFNTEIDGLEVRIATMNDVATILSLIKELSSYEKLENEVTATEEILQDSLFVKNCAEVWLISYQGNDIGYIIFFTSFSTFLGKHGIYLEDLFIKKEYRGKGFGRYLLRLLAQEAIKRDCGRVEWNCLNWNTPSLNFYKNIGAKPLDEWTYFRLSGEALANFAKNKK